MGKRSRSGLLAALSQLNRWANCHSGWLLLAGLAGVGLCQWRLWVQDQTRLVRRRRSDPPPLDDWLSLPQVTALVAAWNEALRIQCHIRSFISLRYPHKQLVLVAGGEDETFELAMPFSGEMIRVLRQRPGEGKQAALRRGLEHAKGEIIYLTDADCLFNDQALEAILAPLVAGNTLAATGCFQPLPEQQNHPFVQMQWCLDLYGRAGLPGYVQGLIGRNAALARSLLAATGDFKDPAPIGTDYLLARQILALGQPILYVHESTVATHFQTRLKPYLHQQSRWLRNILVYSRRFHAWDQYWDALGQCFTGGLVWTTLFLAPLSGFFRAVAGSLLVFGVLSRWRYLDFGRRSGVGPIHPATPLLAPLYFLIDQAMLAYTLLTLLSRPRRSRW
jgi:cellulose synthase/poly-beta-1,6-N-acetylglucosamine synthase-like glycosyltransferase